MTDKKTQIDPITHDDQRVNIPTPELAPMMDPDDARPIKVAYEQRNPDLDPQLIWRGKDIDQTEITVDAPPIYLQEQVHPKAIIEDLRAGGKRNGEGGGADLFDHFGITDDDREAEIEFYRHHRKWSNRMILGDGLQVMASLAEREGLKGQVQAIYIDPPYGIKFNSNFQWSTTSRDVKDGNLQHLTREPEQVKAFRDTWRDGIQSYLQYLRDRLVVARELLTESGSCFIQIGDENVHRARALMDEVFGEENFISQITFRKGMTLASSHISNNSDFIIWFAKNRDATKIRKAFQLRDWQTDGSYSNSDPNLANPAMFKGDSVKDGTAETVFSTQPFHAAGVNSSCMFPIDFFGNRLTHPRQGWKSNEIGMTRAKLAGRLIESGNSVRYKVYFRDYPVQAISNNWFNLGGEPSKTYVVQTATKVVERCLLMTTDPGDLVLDPTCGSGTTAYVAEQWGRRWITIDTSRVALALARARIMGAKYPWYLLKDSEAGQKKEAEVTRSAPSTADTWNDIRHGFVYQRVPHITLKSIANNTEIDTIWDQMQPAVEEALHDINYNMDTFPCRHPVETGGRKGSFVDFKKRPEVTLPSGEEIDGGDFMEWEVPRKAETPMEGEVLKLWNTARRARDKQDPQFDEWLEALNDAIEDPSYGHLGRKRSHHGFTEDSLDEVISDEGVPMLPWPRAAAEAHARFWEARIARQKEIDASIAAKADHEYLYDKPYEDKKRVRVAGPFTVESLSPHRTQAVNEQGELIDEHDAASGRRGAGEQEAENYRTAILENLAKAGVQQAGREDRIDFTSLSAWPGEWLAAEGRYMEGETERRAGILIGPEYGTLQRADLVAAAREAADAGFDLVIACAFNFDAHTAEFQKLGKISVLQARMNADLHMAGDLKAGGGNLFVVFGEPDIKIVEEGDRLRVRLLGVDIFRPATGEVSSSDPDEIACWFIDTDYDEQSFFVRHAYFPGAEIPYKQLKTTLKAEIDEEAWESLKRTESRAFARPRSGRIAVKVINHLGDEVMKVIGV
ncbi:DNA methylase [Roseivivax halodurans JCM 10272]|uniref:site-specific DNA-methyltransferase (adenine-specific) n=1 Tax=Roseivivax halodurans JCM 10272 TaxID=1449350 RepID=X7EK44_9RHOB|nr:site-specific DNA-methyltransferase [Roseivivax halodurans]ETX15513.1 DNA methylase [Roseivivax halodurans JCM 10272]